MKQLQVSGVNPQWFAQVVPGYYLVDELEDDGAKKMPNPKGKGHPASSIVDRRFSDHQMDLDLREREFHEGIESKQNSTEN